MKLAVSGKGGVGKSTIAAALALLLAQRGQKVLALDMDPDANLATCLGLDTEAQRAILPIAQRRRLIEERTGARVREYGQIFKLNPEVSDLADTYATLINDVSLLVLGSIEQGGSGCACPENVLARALVTDLVLYKDQSLILDMEAGIEHLGRGTARGVDTLLIVVEPGQRSIDTAYRVLKMAGDIGLDNIRVLGNKVTDADDALFIRNALPDIDLLSMIPYSKKIREADRAGFSVLEGMSDTIRATFEKMLDYLIREIDR